MDFKKTKPSKNFKDVTGSTGLLRARMDMLLDFLSAPKNARKSYMPDYEGRRYKPIPTPIEGPEGNVLKNILFNDYIFMPQNSPPGPGGIYDQFEDDLFRPSQDNIDAMAKPLPPKKKKKK